MPQQIATTNNQSGSHAGVGLLLTGGGARAAYQAGVLAGVTELLDDQVFPYRFISGTSAGSINAAYLASRATQWPQAAGDLCDIWAAIRAERVFTTEMLDWYLRGARWISWLALPRLISRQPEAILDNSPLIDTLRELIDTDAIDQNLAAGLFDAIGIGASSYTSGRHVTFYQARADIDDWQSADRVAVRQHLTIQHPLMPLVEAGARRILAVSVAPEERASMFAARIDNGNRQPTLAQVAGHALASVFYDALPAEIDQINRINAALKLLQQELPESFPFRPVEVVAISPSEPIESIAMRHVKTLPRRVRSFLKTFGGTESSGMALASYLLFEPTFTSELIDLGKHDAHQQADRIRALFSPQEPEMDADALDSVRKTLRDFFERFKS